MKRIFSLFILITLILLQSATAIAITSVPIQSIELDTHDLTLVVGQTYQLKISCMPQDTTQRLLRFYSNDSSVANIDLHAQITALKCGTAIINVYSIANESIYANCSIAVIEPPQAVQKTSPSDMAEDVGIANPIEIWFKDGFQFDKTSGKIRIADPDGNVVQCSRIAVSPENRNKITFYASLKNNTMYTATIMQGSATDAGNIVSGEYIFRFKTAPKEPEQAVMRTLPSDGQVDVKVSFPIEIYFKDGFNFNATSGAITVMDSKGHIAAIGKITIQSGNQNKISFLVSLKNNENYKIKLREGSAIDSEGTISKEYLVNFKTSRKTGQAIQKTTPADGQTNVNASSSIRIYLKAGYRYNGNGTITIKDPTGETIAFKSQKSQNTGLITINASLKKNTKYTVTLGEGLGYDNKETYSSKYIFSFMTKK